MSGVSAIFGVRRSPSRPFSARSLPLGYSPHALAWHAFGVHQRRNETLENFRVRIASPPPRSPRDRGVRRVARPAGSRRLRPDAG